MQKSIKTLYIFLLGPGKVGKSFIRFLLTQQNFILSVFNVEIIISGIFRSGAYIFDPKGFNEKELRMVIEDKNRNWLKTTNQTKSIRLMRSIPKQSVLIDTSASDKTFPLILDQLKKGQFVVVSNKKTLTQDFGQYKKLIPHLLRFYFETTVGAGLPVISTIKELIETGDNIKNIEGCFSGTLGFIFSQLEKGSSFADAVITAKEKGFTEPDPRDDLSGVDVARKALILSRLMGKKISLDSIQIQSLYPTNLKKVTAEQFLTRLPLLNKEYDKRIKKALKNGRTLRYIATVSKTISKVGLEEVPLSSDIGSLQGPDNIVRIRSGRYDLNPMIIKGPGAGIDVTASGVLGDLLKIIKLIKGV